MSGLTYRGTMTLRGLWSLLLGLLLASSAASGQGHGDEYDFALPPSFLEQLRTQKTLETTVRVVLTDHTANVHAAAKDCEMHLAGTLAPANAVDWDPEHIVVEPPNLCVNDPPGGGSWATLFDTSVLNHEVNVTGFFRVFTEHASGKTTPANPNHTFEMHPATAIGAIDFHAFLPPPPELGAITAKSAKSCLEQRTVSVKYNPEKKWYEFRDQGGQCGNFVILQVASITGRWIAAVGFTQRGKTAPNTGGHSAIARVSADGMSRQSVKLYTMPKSTVDDWLMNVKKEKIDPAQVFLHGIFTYDWFAFVKALQNRQTGKWAQPTSWTVIPHPLAFVAFGTTETEPRGWLGSDDQ